MELWMLTAEEFERQPGVVFHGSRGATNLTLGRPIFFTSDREGAEWYACEHGDMNKPPQVCAAIVNMQSPASYNDLMEVVRRLGVEPEEIQQYSPYDGNNPLDYLYVPTVQDELVKKGFDGYSGWDVLTNYEIPIVVPFHPKQIMTHKMLVQQAILDGKPVPSAVAAEYPDLNRASISKVVLQHCALGSPVDS